MTSSPVSVPRGTPMTKPQVSFSSLVMVTLGLSSVPSGRKKYA